MKVRKGFWFVIYGVLLMGMLYFGLRANYWQKKCLETEETLMKACTVIALAQQIIAEQNRYIKDLEKRVKGTILNKY